MTKQNEGCLPSILRALGFGGSQPKPEPEPAPEEILPYRLRDDFLSPAELNFYRVLQQTVQGQFIICPKVSLGDLFYAKSGDRQDNQGWRNKIDRKHVDFLLCDPRTIKPVLGLELDDASHQQAERQQRDTFVEAVFQAAKLPLIRQRVQTGYNTQELAGLLQPYISVPVQSGAAERPQAEAEAPTAPACPQCNQPMILRTVNKEGPHYGKQFWGCKDYPRCRGMLEYKAG